MRMTSHVELGPNAVQPKAHGKMKAAAPSFDNLFAGPEISQDSVTASQAANVMAETTRQKEARFALPEGSGSGGLLRATSSMKMRKLKRDATQKVIIHEDYYHERALQYAERLKAKRSKHWRPRLSVFLDDPMSSRWALAFAIAVALAIMVQLLVMLLLSWRVIDASTSGTIDMILTIFLSLIHI